MFQYEILSSSSSSGISGIAVVVCLSSQSGVTMADKNCIVRCLCVEVGGGGVKYRKCLSDMTPQPRYRKLTITSRGTTAVL